MQRVGDVGEKFEELAGGEGKLRQRNDGFGRGVREELKGGSYER